MASTVPKSKPKLERKDAIAILKHCLRNKYDPNVVTLLGIRDYYLDSMGRPGVGDYNIYDGALILVAPDEYRTFNFNTDPSSVTKNGRELARLNAGVYEFYRGKHRNSYRALRMYPEGIRIECSRAGKPSTCASINLHKGGIGTWSEGCQTVPGAQYSPGPNTFQPLLWRLMDALPHPAGDKTGSGQPAKIIRYVLVENKMVDGKAVFLDQDGKIIDYEKPAAAKPKTAEAKPATPKKKPAKKPATPKAEKDTKPATKPRTSKAVKAAKTSKGARSRKARTPRKAKKTTRTVRAVLNRSFFFDQVRSTLFHGHLKQTQVTGLTAILDEWENNHDEKDDRWLAYILATAHHETDARIEAIEEYGKGAGKKYGNPDPKTGRIYYGRGLVQLTWKANYEALSKALAIDLVNNPVLALDLDNAVKIMFYGMMNGSFGRKLSDYFKPGVDNPSDWRNARRTVNVLDRADLIAGYAKQYYAAISYMN